MKLIATILGWALCLAVLPGCHTVQPLSLQRFEYTRLCMGVRTQIVLYANASSTAEEAAAAAFARIGELDACMSDYRRDSELSRLCKRAGTGPITVSHDLFEVLRTSLEISRGSGGAFDITIGPLMMLWREARRDHALPKPDSLRAAQSRAGWQNLVLDESGRTVALHKGEMRLDLGGIGKGYAAQQAVDLLKQRGLRRCLVALAGDIVAGDPPPGEKGWRIALSPLWPRSGQDSLSLRERAGVRVTPPKFVDEALLDRSLLLANAAVSTSGDAEQFIDIGGVRYSHIIDPRTGLGVTNRLTVTVLAPRGELADGLASAACVVGLHAIADLLTNFPHTSAIVINSAKNVPTCTIIDPEHQLQWSAEGAAP